MDELEPMILRAGEIFLNGASAKALGHADFEVWQAGRALAQSLDRRVIRLQSN